jgi:hypothetical protein
VADVAALLGGAAGEAAAASGFGLSNDWDGLDSSAMDPLDHLCCTISAEQTEQQPAGQSKKGWPRNGCARKTRTILLGRHIHPRPAGYFDRCLRF